jgi:hypothetical protein
VKDSDNSDGSKKAEKIFQKMIRSITDSLNKEQRKKLPLGIVFLERNGSLSSLMLSTEDENHDDIMSSMMALEYIAYAFERDDWMLAYYRDMTEQHRKLQQKKQEKNRPKLILIKGGKEPS